MRGPFRSQATNSQSIENTLQRKVDSLGAPASKHRLTNIRFRYRRFRYQNIAQNDSPTINCAGFSLSECGGNGGTVRDNQDIL